MWYFIFMTPMNKDDRSGRYPIVGRPDVDLSSYLVDLHGRNIIDYEKLKNDDPKLYERILADENEENRQNDINLLS